MLIAFSMIVVVSHPCICPSLLLYP